MEYVTKNKDSLLVSSPEQAQGFSPVEHYKKIF